MASALRRGVGGEPCVEVDVHRPGDVPALVRGAAGAAIEVPADVGEHDAVAVLAQPAGVHDGGDHARNVAPGRARAYDRPMRSRPVRVAAALVALVVAFLGGSALYQAGHGVIGIGLAVAALVVGYLAFAPSSASRADAVQTDAAWGRPVKPEGFERPPGGRDLL